MARRSYRVLFVGPGISGRRSSLERVIECSEDKNGLAVSIRPGEPVSFEWKSQDGTRVSIEALVFGALSNRFFVDRAAVEANKWARNDLAYLQDCDGIVFLLDAQPGAIGHQHAFYERFAEWLDWCERDLYETPHVVLLNKTDIDNGSEVLQHFQGKQLVPLDHIFKTVATEGKGICNAFDCFVDQLMGIEPVPRHLE